MLNLEYGLLVILSTDNLFSALDDFYFRQYGAHGLFYRDVLSWKTMGAFYEKP
jgi:hypothetical protein